MDNHKQDLSPDSSTVQTMGEYQTESPYFELHSVQTESHYSESQALQPETTQPFKTYKRRFIGLALLVGLNLVVSWNWLTFASIPQASSEYLGVSNSAVAWLSIASLFAFAVGSPFMIWALNNHGPKYSIVVGSGIILAGSWIRYVAAHVTRGRYAVALTGQIVTGISQPFVLAVSTRYNKLWFSDKGQIAAVAAVSLANPLGGAIGEFLSPLIADNASGLPNLLLYTAVVSTVVTLPAPFIPKAPPSPPSATATVEFRHFRAAIRSLSQNKAFLLLIVAFWVYVGLFDMTSSIFGQILIPYGFSQTEAGIAGAAEIFGGVVISAIVSPILDRTKAFKFAVRLLIPIIAICYTILIFLPGFRSAAGLYTVCVVLGGASFSLMPMVLELLTQVTHPISPEISSIIAWIGGGTLGGILIIVSNALETSSGWNGQPEGSMIKGLILQAVLAWAALPAALIVVSMKPNGRSIF